MSDQAEAASLIRFNFGSLCKRGSLFAPLVLIAGCNSAPSTHVTEIKCGKSGFSEGYKCQKIERLGAELEIKVNMHTQKVQLTIINDVPDNWLVRDVFLENCSVIDNYNWNCTDILESGPNALFKTKVETKYSMVRGRYHSMMYNGMFGFYTSSISGIPMYLYRYGLISLESATSYNAH